MTLFAWLKYYFWREPAWAYAEEEWAKKWGDPFVAYQEGDISKGKLCEIIVAAVREWEGS
jgi:hypothetical protein